MQLRFSFKSVKCRAGDIPSIPGFAEPANNEGRSPLKRIGERPGMGSYFLNNFSYALTPAA